MDYKTYAASKDIVSEGRLNSGRWTVEEHKLFLKGLKQYGKNWKSIQNLIKSRSATQVRTHAQKFFSRDTYQATKRGRYASRLKDIETPDMMNWLRSHGTFDDTTTSSLPLPRPSGLVTSTRLRRGNWKGKSMKKEFESKHMECVHNQIQLKELHKSQISPNVKSSPEAKEKVLMSLHAVVDSAMKNSMPKFVLRKSNVFSDQEDRSIGLARYDRFRRSSTMEEHNEQLDKNERDSGEFGKLEPLEFFVDGSNVPIVNSDATSHNNLRLPLTSPRCAKKVDADCLKWLASYSESTMEEYYGKGHPATQ